MRTGVAPHRGNYQRNSELHDELVIPTLSASTKRPHVIAKTLGGLRQFVFDDANDVSLRFVRTMNLHGKLRP